MKSLFLIVLTTIFISGNIFAQQQCPGITVVGSGYDVFDEYANNKSVKEPLFTLGSYQNSPMDDGQEYKIPELVRLKFINEKNYKTTEGSSLRQYASSMSAEVGVGYDGFLFSGSVNSRFGSENSKLTRNYFYTITDWTRVWKVYINPAKTDLRQYLTADAKIAIDTWSPEKLFQVFGTHYVSSGYFGGAMEFNLSEKFTSQSDANSISVSVKARYANVSANTSVSFDKSSVNESMKSNTKIYTRGGDVQYANKSSAGDNSQYNLWVNSIPTKAVLIDFEEGSLVAIWTLAGTQVRKDELEAAFKLMLKNNPLPEGNSSSITMQNQIYFIKSKADNLYWDLPGYHFDANNSGTISLWEKDNNSGQQGIDRFIKIIQHNDGVHVYLQPQHSNNVAVIASGSTEAGAELVLYKMEQDKNVVSRYYKLVEVTGEPNTFYIQNAKSGLYLTSNGKEPITQETKTGADNQKWVFETANPNEMAAPPAEIYSMQNVKGKRYIDVPGGAPNQQQKGAKLTLWDMDNQPDRYMQLINSNIDGYFYVQPLHGENVWDIQGISKENGAKLQLFTKNNTPNQQFKFVYAGSPMTYFIINRNSNKAIDASDSQIDRNGCPITQWESNGGDQQKWVLNYIPKWQMPPKDQAFLIKSAYTNKYWDLPGTGTATNVNGKGFTMWDLDEGGDRKFKFQPSGDNSWVNLVVQNGGRMVSVPSNSKDKGKQIVLWDVNNSPAKKFAVMFTSPTTFALVTNNGKVIDIYGGSSDDWKQNGAKLTQWDAHYLKNQQFKLIYADGPNKGKIYNFLKMK